MFRAEFTWFTSYEEALQYRMAEETKIIYYIDDESTPYLIKVPLAPEKVTLGELKNVLQNKTCYKYFFKSEDHDFG